MTDLKTAAQQALDILDSEFTSLDGEFCRWCDGRLTNPRHNCKLEQTITALRAALAEPEQKPVAWMESPYGAIRANPAYKIKFPSQLLHWQIPLFIAPQQQAEPVQSRADAMQEMVAASERAGLYELTAAPGSEKTKEE